MDQPISLSYVYSSSKHFDKLTGFLMHKQKQQAHTKYTSILDEIEQYAIDFTAKRTPLERCQ